MAITTIPEEEGKTGGQLVARIVGNNYFTELIYDPS